MGESETGKDIVRTILSLAQNLDLKVIAEGVETEEQLALLNSMKCDLVQGFLFATPVSSSEAGGLLAESFGNV